MKLALCIDSGNPDCAEVAKKMARAQQMTESHTIDNFMQSDHALACVRSSERFSDVELLRHEPNGNLLAISGVPFLLQGSLNAHLAKTALANSQEAIQLLTSLDGGFSAIHWDQEQHRLAIVTDPLGAQPLYLAKIGKRILLATELKAFPASGLLNVKMDRAGWGSFLSLGFNTGCRTQLAGVERVDSATVICIDPRDGSIRSNRYWSWPGPQPKLSSSDVNIPELQSIVSDELRGYQSHSSTATLLFSGGFDSRLLLGALHHAGINCPALTVANREEVGGVEAMIASRITRKINGADSTVVYPSPGYYCSPAYLKYLVMNEVTIPSLGLFIANVWQFLQSDMRAIWEGVFPGYGFAPPFPHPGGFAEYCRHRVKPRSSLHWKVALRTFSRDMALGMYEEFDGSLKEEMSKYSDDEYGVNEFQINNQMRRRLGASPYKVFANFVMPFTPCISKDYWQLTAGIPLAIRGDKKFYMKVLNCYSPDLLSVPICSAGRFYSQEAISPLLWMTAKRSMLKSRCQYFHQRFLDRYVNRLFHNCVSVQNKHDNDYGFLVDQVLKSIMPDHPELNADAVVAIQQATDASQWEIRLARSILFYWQVWRWVMEGHLTTGNAEKLHEGLISI